MVDPYDPSYFRHAGHFHTLNVIISGHNATVAMWAAVIGALAIALLRSDLYLRMTVYYTLEAILDSEILTQALKGVDRRLRPQDVMTYHHLFDSWFQDKGPWYAGPGSFPSGHMIAAISIAAVFAIRYRHHVWVPWTAYGMAGIVGFSRITLLSHFPSDVFAGAFLGYVIVRYVVFAEVRPAVASQIEIEVEVEAVRAVAAR
ncbi:MAG: phosphatase PAP2 family protein [Terriglobia bacterium]